jgi:hypothetical protein
MVLLVVDLRREQEHLLLQSEEDRQQVVGWYLQVLPVLD